MTDWSFAGTWPYEPHFFETTAGRLHYIAEGSPTAAPVVLLHGNPTWSYLYRHLIDPLVEAGHRVVAIDHLGFGRSEVPSRAELLTVRRHQQRLGELLDHLDLTNLTVVLHDWAGPIVLPWLVANAARMAGLMTLNTFAPRLPGPIGQRGSLRMLRSRLFGPYLVKKRDVPTEGFLFRAGTARPEQFDEVTKAAYRAPHDEPEKRIPMLVFPREIPFSSGAPLARQSAQTADALPELLASVPVTICWGMQDGLFGPEVLDAWQQLLPGAQTVRLEDAGHFLQEDAPAAVLGALIDLLQRIRGAAAA